MSLNAIAPLGWAWAVCGFIALLILGISRMFPHTLEALGAGLSFAQWCVLLVNVIAMAYVEGYKGFQLGFSPRFAARAHALFERGTGARLCLAPLFSMGFFDAPRRRIISAVALALTIIVLVCIFRLLPQPWRGILDAGVVVGLVWGALATVYLSLEACITDKTRIDPEIVD